MKKLVLSSQNINSLINSFLNHRSEEGDHRYESFDFCYAYFQSFADKTQISQRKHLENSCLHLAWYLGSWGMLRGSSFLLQKSLRFYKKVIQIASKAPIEVWELDVDRYDEMAYHRLIELYKDILELYPTRRPLTLTTKIMLGIFGNAPAMDRYVTSTLRKIYPENGFTSFKKSLSYFKQFYDEHESTINSNYNKVFCRRFKDGQFTATHYPKIKLIDMIMFEHARKG
jgi:hypothetical protein